jgi:branched-chain amino acid transport system permease protein
VSPSLEQARPQIPLLGQSALKLLAGAVAALLACRIIFDAPYSIILDGVALGSLYGLIGAGVILIYRTNRIINFAAAGLGAVPAVAAVLMIVNKGWSWFIMFPAAIIGGAILGGLVDVIIIRRFASAPRLILTVVTIGVSQLLAFIAIFLPRWIEPPGGGEGGFISEVKTPFISSKFNVGTRPFSGDYPFAVFFVLVLVVALALFFRYTRIGIALRASAENADRASLLGIPVRRVGTVAWIIAGAFAAVTIFIRSTLVGVPVDGTLGPVVLLYALAAAVIARMESVPICMAAGIGIGMIDQASVFKTARNSLAGAIMLIVILGALLLQRTRLSRAQDTGVSSFSNVKEFRPIPTELRGVREVVAARTVLGLVVAFVLLGAPFFLGHARLSRATPLLIYSIVAVSLVVLTGWAGQISLGQFGIVGIGALIAGGLAANNNIDFFAALFLGIVGGAFVAVLVGVPALRVQGLYLAVTTLAFAGAVSGYVLNPEYPIGKRLLPEGGNRIERFVLWERFDLGTTDEVKWFGPDFTLQGDAKYYYFCLVFLGLALLVAKSYRRNRAGRILIAVRDNSRAAPSYAINLARNRLAAFAISGAFASAAGVLLAYDQGAIDPSSYGIGPSIFIFTATVIGGLTSLPGAVFGTILIGGIDTYGDSYLEGISLLVTGPGLVMVLMFLPGGLAEGMYRLRDSFLLWVAKRHDILVPSLVADRRVETGEDQADVITEAEHKVEETESFDLLGGPTIACPTCGQVLSLDDAPEHEHFRVSAQGGLDVEAQPEPVGVGGGRSRLSRARGGRS